MSFPFHAILVSVYPILYLYARNIGFIPFGDTTRSLIIAVGLSFLFLIGFRIILKGWEKAGVLCSVIFILFFSFGHLANQLETWLTQQEKTFDVSLFAWIWVVLFLALSYIILRVNLPEKSTQLFNLISLMLILFPGATIIATNVDRIRNNQAGIESLSQLRGEEHAEATMPEIPQSEMPDIYYIIFDAYERADILKEYYEYDNSSFLAALEGRGFYIADSSRSNYLTTTYSLNTSLNLLYFHEFPAALFKQARYNLYTNYVNTFLQEQGYQIVVFDSGTGDSNFQYADIFEAPSESQSTGSEINPFEQLLLRTTLGLVLFKRGSLNDSVETVNDVVISNVNRELDVRRERIRHAMGHLPDYVAQDGPTFLFAHIYLPHFPFLYGPGGEELRYHENVNLYWYEVEPENYVENYTYQVDYLNQTILETIDKILAESETPLVIILQADHGDEKFLDWEEPTAQGVNVRSGILNAIYYSDGAYEMLYPSMTPVNTFRVTLNHWFGTQYPLLPDKVFFHEHPVMTPFNVIPEFIESCARFNICLPDRTN